VQRNEAVEIDFIDRQRLIGGVLAGEQRVAAAGGHFLDIEYRAHRRLQIARHVGMPALAIGAGGILVGVDLHQRGIVASCGRPGECAIRRSGRPKARCCSGLMLLLRKKITRFSASARWISSIWRFGRSPSETSLRYRRRNLRADDRGQFFDAMVFIGLRFRRRDADSGDLFCGQRAHDVSPRTSIGISYLVGSEAQRGALFNFGLPAKAGTHNHRC